MGSASAAGSAGGRSTRRAPLFMSPVWAGFPSPAADYVEERLDINRYLVRRPAATFFVKVRGDSMTGAGIHSGDILVVDRSEEPTDGKVVVAALDGELTVKRIRFIGDKVLLVADSDGYSPIAVDEGAEFAVWGVVKHSIHSL